MNMDDMILVSIDDHMIEPLRRHVVVVHVGWLDQVVVDADQDHVVHLHGGLCFSSDRCRSVA